MYALIKNGIVKNVIEADAAFVASATSEWDHIVETSEVGVDWTYNNGVFSAPNTVTPTYKSWPAFDFYRKFTSAERIAIRERAKTDPIAEDIYGTLNAAIASGSNVRSDDPDTVAGLAYLESKGDLAPGRAAEILA